VKVAKTKTKKTAGKQALPRWDLSDLAPAPAGKNVTDGLARALKDAKAFRKKYAGKVARLSPAAFGRAIGELEAVRCRAGRLYCYAMLDRQTKLNDAAAGRLLQDASERYNDLSTEMMFFRLEINKMPDAALAAKLKDKTVARYRPWISAIRDMRPYQLADDVERALAEHGVIGHPAWSRLFDETAAALRYPIGGKDLAEAEAFHLLSHSDAKKRKEAGLVIGKVLEWAAPTFSLALNTIAKEREIDDRQRGFKTPVASRNLENQLDDEVTAALVSAVRAYYPRLSHRYYKLKAKWLGVKRLNPWDRNAPLPFFAERKIPWVEAQNMVLSAYGGFHPRMAGIARKFFDNPWIDAAPYPGKTAGAFSAEGTPDTHPFILMNYKDDVESVMTLAHELGHGIHQSLAAGQGYLMMDTSLPLAETASVFGEMLTFRSFLAHETDARARKAVIANKIEDMLNTVVRQVAFHEFETAFHTARRKGEVEPARIQQMWLKTMTDSLGPAFVFDDGYRHYWSYISHFFHVPFYVYAYAFGDCLVNALYAVYQERPKGFADKYVDLLSAGGTKRHAELLKPFGLNANDPGFWKKGLSVIENLIDQVDD
jgi:oligoendopeptidase F